MRVCLLVLCLMFLVSGGFAQNTDMSFAKANDYYRQGDYQHAEKEYLKIIDKGNESGALYYNLGNVYFKLNNKGKAILYYEKAKKLIPRDNDLKVNLSFLNTLIKDKAEASKRSFLASMSNRFYSDFTLSEFTVATSLVYFLLIFSLILAFFLKVIKVYIKWIVAILGLILIFSASFLTGKLYDKAFKQEAIIVVPEAKVYYAPTSLEDPAFIIHSGLKISVKKQQGDWCLISIDENKAGWIEKSLLEII